MRCENCDAITEWKGDHDNQEYDFDPSKWVFVRKYECKKCGCKAVIFYPKDDVNDAQCVT